MIYPKDFFNLEGFRHQELFQGDLPVWEALIGLKEYLNQSNLGQIDCEIPEGVTLVHRERISIGKETCIEPGAYIEGPCMIGEGCRIRHGAYIRPFVLMGDQCMIGHSTEVKHAIFFNRAQAPHFNYVGDSILGNRVNLGAGVICANFRLDKGEIVVDIQGKKYPTGLHKLGTILGDDSQLGCNSVINPGVILRKKTYSRACSSIQKSNLRNDDHAQAADSSENIST